MNVNENFTITFVRNCNKTLTIDSIFALLNNINKGIKVHDDVAKQYTEYDFLIGAFILLPSTLKQLLVLFLL